MQSLLTIRAKLFPSSSQACVFEPLSPRQDEDAEEGKKLLQQNQEALLEAALAGDETKVGRILPPCISIPTTIDVLCAQADVCTLIPPRPAPLSAFCDHEPQHSTFAAGQVRQLIACGADMTITDKEVLLIVHGPDGERRHLIERCA